MLITDLSESECLDLIARARVARLACARDGQPYVVPISCVYQDGYVYCASTEGKKVEWMRTNPLVCLEMDEVRSPQNWTSLIVDGRFEEILNDPEWESERRLAWSILQQRPIWWEPAYVQTIVNRTEKELRPLYFRIHVVRMSGRRGAKDTSSS